MTAHVRLKEWERVGPADPRGIALRGLRLDPATRTLAARLGAEQTLSVVELYGGISVESYSHVGRVELGELTITVEPKLAASELLRLVRYTYGLRNLHLVDVAEFASGTAVLQDLLVAQLLAEVRELLRRGLRRQYVALDEDLSSPRGRIDMARLVNAIAAQSTRLPCRHSPRSSDFLLNQVLAAGLRLAAGVANDRRLRADAGRLAGTLAELAAPISLNASVLARARRSMTRLVAPYTAAIRLVELLHFCSSITLDDGSTLKLPGFLFDMNRFFQALVARLLADNLGGYRVQVEQPLTDLMRYQPGANPKGRSAPRPRPDFVVTAPGHQSLLLDAKYRDLWERELPRDMLYQLSIYALSQPSGATAAIIYPTTDAAAREAVIEISDPVTGGGRAYVALRPLVVQRVLAALEGDERDTMSRLAERLAHGHGLGTTPGSA